MGKLSRGPVSRASVRVGTRKKQKPGQLPERVRGVYLDPQTRPPTESERTAVEKRQAKVRQAEKAARKARRKGVS